MHVLTSADVEQLVDWDGLVAELERVHVGMARGHVVQPAPHALRDPRSSAPDAAAIVPMMSMDADRRLFAVKVLADAPANRTRGLPAQRSTVSLYDADTGACLAIVDGAALTRLRTAAMTLLATRALARPDARTLAVAGAGPLAVEHVRALTAGHRYDDVRLWSRSEDRARTAIAALDGAGIAARAVPRIDALTDGADVVCTLTPSARPILDVGQLADGVHVNAVGSPPRPAYTEVTPAVFARAHLVAVDALAVALADSGNVRNAVDAGSVAVEELVELGAILAGDARGRTGASQVTVFNSVGIGGQDLAAVVHVLDRARAVGAGTTIALRG
ncbi:ornithine cyclodeaminase family protein [Microbacterium sp. No. 7]|uniref:ornithine cyclodeaminase family protein n=1 Tax=Microbacterium sp. No. 7 TaxID=1714373 RepID=UPI0006D036E2|nr:ornithine cyclodeaminase family protein [Microbacterium sp. No. 7]ALJ20141.1 hypothetical protein AOA12_09545 [Microbacterium sp. No. 7]